MADRKLLVVAHTYSKELGGYVVLAVRICTDDEVPHTVDLMIKQIRKRFMIYENVKPREIRRTVTFDVYGLEPARAGWPMCYGPASDWSC